MCREQQREGKGSEQSCRFQKELGLGWNRFLQDQGKEVQAAQICVKPLRKHNLAGIVCSKTELKTGILIFFSFCSSLKV